MSGVADPAAAAAWGTVPPFEPAGVIVLADATSVVQRSRDRYVGAEVVRQLAGADLVVVTKSDACDEEFLAEVERWLATASSGAPSIRVVDGRIPSEVILGVRSSSRPVSSEREAGHDAHYESWSWTSPDPVRRVELDRFLATLPAEVLRVKGRVQLDDGSWMLVQVVGRRIDVTPTAPAERSELVAISRHTDLATNPFVLQFG